MKREVYVRSLALGSAKFVHCEQLWCLLLRDDYKFDASASFLHSMCRHTISSEITDIDNQLFKSAASGLSNGTAAHGLTWRAVAATPTVNQCDPYLGGDSSLLIYTTSGTLVALNRTAFLNSPFQNKISFDQLKNAALNFVWTGCAPYGVASAGKEFGAAGGITIYGTSSGADYTGVFTPNLGTSSSIAPVYAVSQKLKVPGAVSGSATALQG